MKEVQNGTNIRLNLQMQEIASHITRTIGSNSCQAWGFTFCVIAFVTQNQAEHG